MSNFHFSPRPNRAHEINWHEWGKKAFEEARGAGKLVLLSISGVWCHWCHVMDETSYSDPEVIKLINEDFVPIRVDTDQRPDVNERYNLGGWPTTAVLSPAGELLTGGTYIPPEKLKPFLRRLARSYRENRDDFILAERPDPWEGEEPARNPVEELTPEPYERMIMAVKKAYDPEYGGFGREPKFPMVEAIELALYGYATHGDEELREIATHTLAAMAGGGTYDPVEGGFFRYSTTRDWSIPHFEKMLEDNALLLRCLLLTYQATGESKWAGVARDVLRYLVNNLYQTETGGWSGTQDADEEYYSLDMEERRQRPAPFIDRNLYVNWNGFLARSLYLAGWTLEERRWRDLAVKTLDMIWERAFHPEKGMAHFLADLSPRVWGLLDDQVATGEACMAVFQGTGEERWLDRGRRLSQVCQHRLAAPGGGFYDVPPDPEAPGALAVPRRDVRVNAQAARWLLEMAALTGEETYREQATSTLKSLGNAYNEYGLMGAGYALAVAEALAPWKIIKVVGRATKEATRRLVHAGLTTYRPPSVTLMLDPETNREQVLAAGYPVDEPPQAYLCIGTRCLPPVQQPEGLRDMLAEEAPAAHPGAYPVSLEEENPTELR